MPAGLGEIGADAQPGKPEPERDETRLDEKALEFLWREDSRRQGLGVHGVLLPLLVG
jgi:hypothetical protein